MGSTVVTYFTHQVIISTKLEKKKKKKKKKLILTKIFKMFIIDINVSNS
jgi:hypothetical protein